KEEMSPPINCPLLLTLTNEITLDRLRDAQTSDTETQALLVNPPNDFVISSGLLYKQGKYGGRQPFIPKPLRPHILEYFHDRPESGHLGVRKTLHRLLRRVFWFGLQDDIFTYVKSCVTCQSTK